MQPQHSCSASSGLTFFHFNPPIDSLADEVYDEATSRPTAPASIEKKEKKPAALIIRQSLKNLKHAHKIDLAERDSLSPTHS